MMETLRDVGSIDADFARRFWEDAGIPIVSASLGQPDARRIEFGRASGRLGDPGKRDLACENEGRWGDDG